MQGKYNIVLDAFWGSSGKGKLSTWLAANASAISGISSANFPNAGHTARFGQEKYVYKAMPTASCLNAQGIKSLSGKLYISPASGFSLAVLFSEWRMSGYPTINIHDRACVVTKSHADAERSNVSLMGISSTMQGSGAAAADKISRYPDPTSRPTIEAYTETDLFRALEDSGATSNEITSFIASLRILTGQQFRDQFRQAMNGAGAWLHEGSQGYALSIDHGSHYPYCTSRNCTTAVAMDSMAVPPSMVGDVYLNLRTFPIRVGNYNGNGVSGFSGGWYEDCEEVTWDQVAEISGMPKHEAARLAENERTTVTKRVRRVSTFSYDGLLDAVRTNGATALGLNFVQYIDWSAAGLRGTSFSCLPSKVREMISKIEDKSGVPVVWVGTGPDHDDVVTSANFSLLGC